MTVKSGLSAKTPERIFVDAGAVYLNYGLSDERLLGATRGGNEFNLNREIRDIEVDGVRGSVKGLRRRTVCRPQITCNLIELSLDNLLKAIAGANQDETNYQEAVEGEYVDVGDNSKVIFTLGNDLIVENTEKIFINGTKKTRSKKYDSRFVGNNAVDNKGFAEGVGDWTKGDATDTIEMVSGGQSGNCLKYTASTTPVAGFITLPGGNGAQLTNLVVGQHYRLQLAISKLAGTFTPETITFKCTGGPASDAIAPTTGWVVHVIEFVATGTDATIEIIGLAAPSPDDEFYIDSLELERVDGDYVMNWIKGEVVFPENDVPIDTEYITASYTHATGAAATHDTITGGQIEDTDYIENVALVGNISGKDKAVICMVKNALADAGFSIATAPRDEAVPTIIFTGHFDPADADTEPWEIRYPRA
ncbi:hypothetical protein ES705_08438 [subsurface metagenome]